MLPRERTGFIGFYHGKGGDVTLSVAKNQLKFALFRKNLRKKAGNILVSHP